jgi:hypothetical protein
MMTLHLSRGARFLLGVLFLAAPAVVRAQPPEARNVPDYAHYAKVLKAYVDDRGLVQYAKLKANPGDLNAFLRTLASVRERDYRTWPEDDRIAFWINAYNGVTLKVIVDNYPIEPSFWTSRFYPKNSIRQIDGVWDEITHRVMGRAMTLDEIEHGVLREDFDEPRIHVALVCAAMGCPELRVEPYTGAKLDAQLADQANVFFRTRSKFRIDEEDAEVYLSPIFDWFGEDFRTAYCTGLFDHLGDAEEQAVMNFVRKHVPQDEARWLLRHDFDLEYLDYDWTLNERK